MKYTLNPHLINISEEALLKDLRQTAKRLGKDYLPNKVYAREGKYNVSTFVRRFGGWNIALGRAGLKMKRYRIIPTDELMRNLKHVWDTLNRQPKYLEMEKPLSKYCATVYSNRFGSWNKALEAFIKSVNGSYSAGPARKSKAKTGKHIGKGLRYDILKRDNFKCRLCGASPANDPKVTLHVDHIIPRTKGGETTRQNLQTLCSGCNLGKGSKSD